MGKLTLEQLYASVEVSPAEETLTGKIDSILAAAMHAVGWTVVITQTWFQALDQAAQNHLDLLHERKMFASHYQLALQTLTTEDDQVPPLRWLPDSPMANLLTGAGNTPQ